MAKRWVGVGFILITVLACGVLLVNGHGSAQADSLLRPTDNVTGTDNQTGIRPLKDGVDGCNNTNNGGLLEATSQYVVIDVDCWHAGHCALCDENADYSCWGPDEWCWVSPCPFNDPLPRGQIVTGIEADVRSGSCGNTFTRVYINDILIGAGTQTGDCMCGTCNPVLVASQLYPSGFPGYIYGGLNRLGLQNDGYGCVSDVHLKIYYKKSLVTTTPGSHGAGGYGFDGSLPSQPVKLSNIVVKNASITQTKVAPGEHVNVTATVTNTGISNGAAKITLYVNGQETDSEGIIVSSGQTIPVVFTVSENEPGAYTVYVNSTSAGSFVVDQFTNNDILIYGIIALFTLCIAGTLYLIVRKRTA